MPAEAGPAAAGNGHDLSRWDDPDADPIRGTRASAVSSLATLRHLAASLWSLAKDTLWLLPWRRLERSIMTGPEKHSGMPLRVAYLGDGRSLNYLQKIFFDEIFRTERRRPVTWWQAGRCVRTAAAEADLVVVDVGATLAKVLKIPHSLKVPRWIKQRAPIQGEWNAVLAGLRRKTRMEAQRAIRRGGYRARLRHGADHAGNFYEHLYLPYIGQSHGAAAETVPRRRFISESGKCQMMELTRGDTIVAGAVLRPSGDTLSIVWAGVNIGLPPEQLTGVTDGIDYFTLRYAYAHGFRYLDMGPSRARLNDGLFLYKKKWGAEIFRSRYPQAAIFLAPVNFGPAVRGVFQGSRFIGDDGRSRTAPRGPG